MSKSLSYILEFPSSSGEGVAMHSLGQVDQIMSVIGSMDKLLADILAYRVDYHSMLVSMDAKEFCFQVDMKLSFPEQLILGDSMEEDSQLHWFAQGHDIMMGFLTGKHEEELWEARWQDFIEDNPNIGSILYRPPQWSSLRDLHEKFWSLTGAMESDFSTPHWEDPMKIPLKKMHSALEESSPED
ncbi:MAG: hypothetical protein PF447_07085 [Spirochaetaceae bacterium]|nr:hypothetical protein [Spirochaetaceae bacterium]